MLLRKVCNQILHERFLTPEHRSHSIRERSIRERCGDGSFYALIRRGADQLTRFFRHERHTVERFASQEGPPVMMRCLLIAVLSCAAGAAWAKPAGTPPADEALASFSVEFRPVGSRDAISHLVVRSVLTGVTAAPGEPLLSVPAVFANLRAETYEEGDVAARDEIGPLPLTIDVEPPARGAAVQMRSFSPQRPSRGPIEIRYQAAVTPTKAPRTLGPSYDLRGVGGGFLGGGASFLILPADQARRFRFSLTWNLSELGDDAIGVSTRGAGATTFVGAPPDFMTAFFMGGTLARYPADAGNRPFNAFWIGEPNFDAPGVMAWAGRSFEVIRDFARAPEQAPYYLLARPNPNPTIGGAATRSGFILEYGSNARDENALKLMFTHEMIHHFITGLEGPAMTTSWWHEGLAEFYKLRLPLRAGLIDISSYAEALTGQVESYYRNPNISLPNDQIAARFWADRSVQNLPYARGFMYFATVDAKVRRASHGRRSLDDLVLAMLESRRAGMGYDTARWQEIVSAELGAEGLTDFQAMMAGRTIAPPSDTFGPCFTRRASAFPRRSLGFSDPALQSEPRVENLDPDSAAAQAGLREGDRIVRMEGWRRGEAEDGPGMVTVHVDRQGTTIPVSFDTRTGDLQGFTWKFVASSDPADCIL